MYWDIIIDTFYCVLAQGGHCARLHMRKILIRGAFGGDLG